MLGRTDAPGLRPIATAGTSRAAELAARAAVKAWLAQPVRPGRQGAR